MSQDAPASELSRLYDWAYHNPGAVREYARGYLLPYKVSGSLSMPPAGSMDAAHMARTLFENGLVELVQRRHGSFDYSYLMIARGAQPPEKRTNFWERCVRRSKK